MVLLERQKLLQLLYDGLPDKTSVITNSKVEKVEESPNGVVVTTTNGIVCSGRVVAGADGVHSRVRECIMNLCDQSHVATNMSNCKD